MSQATDNLAFIKWLQARLNALGATPELLVDGWAPLGGKTHTAARILFPLNPSDPPNSSDLPISGLLLSKSAIEILINFEIGDETYYSKYLAKPTWPGASSGVTIGIGYDLGYNDTETFQHDWAAQLDPDAGAILEPACGRTSSNAKSWLSGHPEARAIAIPLPTAQAVFRATTLPKFAALTKATFPGIELLQPDAQTMLVSLVYNRGAAIYGDSRREMLTIRNRLLVVLENGHVTQADLTYIAGQIRSMKRLWSSSALAGLHKRRDREASIIESGI